MSEDVFIDMLEDDPSECLRPTPEIDAEAYETDRGDMVVSVNLARQIYVQLAEARAEAARLQMEVDASCNAEELRQVREENARLRAKMAWLAGQLTDHPCACQWLDDTISELLTP